jgi:hypothetical protein
VRVLLKSWLVAAAAFLLPGMLVLQTYVALYTNAHDDWSTDARMPVGMLLLAVLAGFVAYLVPLLLAGSLPMVVACTVYMVAASAGGAAVRKPVGALVAGMAAGAVGAFATRAPMALHDTAHWWWSHGAACVIAGGVAACIHALVLRPRTAAQRGTALPDAPPASTRAASAAGIVVALAACGLALANAGSDSRESVAMVTLRRAAEASAREFRAATIERQAAQVAPLLAVPGIRASIVERVPGGDLVKRPIADDAQLLQAMASLRPTSLPVPVTRHLGSSADGGATDVRYSVLFIDTYPQRQGSETLLYALRGERAELIQYHRALEGRGKDIAYASMLIGR